MTELIAAIEEYAFWLYALLSVLIIREFLKIWRSGQERQHAIFGLEREAATGKSARSLVVILLLVTIAIGISTTARIIAPAMPQKDRRLAEEQSPLYNTAMPMSIPTDTALPLPEPTLKPPRIVTAVSSGSAANDLVPGAALCRNPDVDIIAPGPGDVLVGPTAVRATVRLDPEGSMSYRIDLGTGSAPTDWRPLVTDQREPRTNSELLTLDAAALASGTYTLRLALVGPDGEVSEENTCSVTVEVR